MSFPVLAHVAALLVLGSGGAPQGADAASTLRSQIDAIARHYHEGGMLDGALLVKAGGETVYRGAFGVADPRDGRPNDVDTAFYLGSVSKQFVAMAVMVLVEDGRLGYDDAVVEHVPAVASFAGEVTLHDLLTHTSGIPDYLNELGAGHDGLTNAQALESLVEHGRLNFAPGTRFSYSNGGYLLLAETVASAADGSAAEFLAERVFRPAGMRRTFVLEPDTEVANRAVGFDLAGEVRDYTYFTVGAGGIYSTVDDLAAWDAALYGTELVGQEALERAFTPATLEGGARGPYGYGWFVREDGAGKRALHLGGNAGCAAYIERDLGTRDCIVVLSNCRDALSSGMVAAIRAVLGGEPMAALPRVELAAYLGALIRREGLPAALERFREILADERAAYDLGEEQLNTLGYRFLAAEKAAVARTLFELNVENHPRSSNARDSLGEACEALGDRAAARRAYEVALELDPSNEIARRHLEALGGES